MLTQQVKEYTESLAKNIVHIDNIEEIVPITFGIKFAKEKEDKVLEHYKKMLNEQFNLNFENTLYWRKEPVIEEIEKDTLFWLKTRLIFK